MSENQDTSTRTKHTLKKMKASEQVHCQLTKEKDPNEKHNLIKDERYAHVRQELKYLLIEQMVKADEARPVILPALKVRKIW